MSASSQELRPRGRRSATQRPVETEQLVTPAVDSDFRQPTIPARPAFAPAAQAVLSNSATASLRPRDAARRARQSGAAESASAQRLTPAPKTPLNDAASQVFPVATPSAAAQGLTRVAVRRGQRNAAALPEKSGWRSAKSAQRGGIALAAAGLALAVVVPNAAGSLAVNTPLANGLPSSVGTISAAADATVDFSAAKTSSKADPDGKLRQVLAVSADKVAPTASKGTLASPLDALRMTSPFGYRVNPLTGASGELHTGQDYAASCGANVYAAAGGTVSFASWHQYGGGNRIVIDHGNGLSTTYNHNTSLNVQVGQKVNRGDLIAQSGTTGNSTGCHVHFEVMVNDKTVDPLGWL